MFTSDPFAAVTDFLFPGAMKLYSVLMILAIFIGTLFDVSHKGSAKYFAQRREKSKTSAKRQL